MSVIDEFDYVRRDRQTVSALHVELRQCLQQVTGLKAAIQPWAPAALIYLKSR